MSNFDEQLRTTQQDLLDDLDRSIIWWLNYQTLDEEPTEQITMEPRHNLYLSEEALADIIMWSGGMPLVPKGKVNWRKEGF